MVRRSSVLVWTTLLATCLSGEIEVQFDGKEWDLPEGFRELKEEDLKEGVCFTADANVPCGVALEGLGIRHLPSRPLRFALRGQEGSGALVGPIPKGKKEASSAVLVVCDAGQVTAAVVNSEAAAAGLPSGPVESMDNDFQGLDKFLGVIREGVKKSRDSDEVPRAVLVVRSETSFGHMVRVLQLVRSAGCHSTVVRLDDRFPAMDFRVLIDPEVEPPVAGIPDAKPSGRIVVNIRNDGTKVTGSDEILEDEKEVMEYVAREKRKFDAEGLPAKLHLRGDSESVFKHSRKVIRAAAEAGVDQVIFAVFKATNKEVAPAPATKIREQDLQMALPATIDEKDDGAANPPVEIRIDAKGGIGLPRLVGILEKDTEKRELPTLEKELLKAAGKRGIRPSKLNVSIHADGKATQQRVIDVLNLLSKLKISKVTIADFKSDEGGG